MIIRLAPAAALCLVVACAPQGGPGASGPEQAALAAERRSDGSCQAREIVPAIYEQVPGQVQVVQAERAADGTVIRPPIYRNATVPKIVRPRGEIRFEVPCPETMTPEFIATLQRALLARGYYTAAITGRMDSATVAAVRRYQSGRGLDSGHLALDTARDLGLVAVALPAP
ncbi:peptidoglycan-binding domain-containing protein [Puniceibacterium confluentis]|uniref:peptidoglycan-binding domain-containing protein n=1 Tax=Puniceibacterium confluentis TaxID=1958944 RepID=UPI0011B57641|nr:peptidoglycan-binding domain-containing protein [Puniceibacterium confluentis]